MTDLPAGLLPGGRFHDWRRTTPRYVVADVDGTLLGGAGTVSDQVVAAMRRARDAGLPVGFATGRMRVAVEPIWERLRLPGPHVLHNGAEVRAEGETIASWPLVPDQTRAVLERCAEHGWYAELYLPDGYVVTDDREEAAVHWHMLNARPSGFTADLDPDTTEVIKATVLAFDGHDPATAARVLEDLGLAVGVATSLQAPGIAFINVTHPDADKGNALRLAARHLDLDLSQVVAVGDGHNDLPMLRLAGTAIAMGQSDEAVRAAAHLVVPEVDEDGVVHAVDAAIGWAT